MKKIDYLEKLPLTAFLSLPSDVLTRTAIRALLSSKARLAMIPMQDLLCLGADSRMNTPALVSEENWSWRLDPAALTEKLSADLCRDISSAER